MEKQVFDQLRAIIYEKSGISLSENKTALVSARLNKRLRALGLASYEDYLDHLVADSEGGELVHFLDVISTNTTSFFREGVHFELLSELLGRWASEGQRKFRIWCAASSSGEEPYTIAMTVNEALRGPGFDVKLLATDISTRILAKAYEGVYAEDRVSEIPRNLLCSYFAKERDPASGAVLYRALPSIRDMISFRRLNLSTPPFPMKGPFDVVLCRNVMIYFDNPVRQRLISEISRLLRPGGYLMVGHSESLTGIKTDLRALRPAVYLKG